MEGGRWEGGREGGVGRRMRRVGMGGGIGWEGYRMSTKKGRVSGREVD